MANLYIHYSMPAALFDLVIGCTSVLNVLWDHVRTLGKPVLTLLQQTMFCIHTHRVSVIQSSVVDGRGEDCSPV